MKNHTLLYSFLLSLCFLISCKKDTEPTPSEDFKKEVVRNYANIVYHSYSDSYEQAVDLQSKISIFVATPTTANLEACKTVWKQARIPYGQTEAYRFSGGVIDGENGKEGLINGWPLDESYIDYVEGGTESGIINHVAKYPNISKNLLIELNEVGGETNISTGYHAIEFLLWGQDLYDDSAGKRPFTDYLPNGTSKNQLRRGQYLKAVSELLVEHLAELKNQWSENGAYRQTFIALPINESLEKICSSIGILSKGELAGERMTVAVLSGEQEDEHSCFSDNTDLDIKMNFKGIRNVYLGKYIKMNGQTIEGSALKELFERSNKEKAEKTYQTLLETDVLIQQITAPFDQLIKIEKGNNDGKIAKAISSLRRFSDKLVDSAFSLGISAKTDKDE